MGTLRDVMDSLLGTNGQPLVIPEECKYLERDCPLDFSTPERLADMMRVEGGLDRLRSPSPLTPLGEVTHTFNNGQEACANAYSTAIRKHRVKILEPSSRPADVWLPDAQSIAMALATLSDQQLRNIATVVIEPSPFGDNPTAVACSDLHVPVIHYFPRSEPHPQGDLDWVFQHEGAHRYQVELGHRAKKDWSAAIAKDQRSISSYGDTNHVEDFAEAVLLYAMTKGTPCEETARAFFPARFKILDRLFPKGFPTRLLRRQKPPRSAT